MFPFQRNNVPVVHSGERIGKLKNAAVVRDDNHGPIAFDRDRAQVTPKSCGPVLASSAEVGSSHTNKCGWWTKRPGDRHALLLTAGELARQIVHPIAHAHFAEQLPSTAASASRFE